MFWFHATKRPAAVDYLGILRSGCKPAPFVNDTQQLEFDLRISPSRVYCYFGRTLEQFGEFCIVFEPSRLPAGEMCPFDSGGLVRKIAPIKDWSADDRAAYLAASSFSTRDWEDLLAAYPADRRASYLNCERPQHAGPHQIWTNVPVAEIWKDATDWRAWTWEGRWAAIPIAGNLRAWTCSPSLFMNIIDAIEGSKDLPSSILDEFLARYKPGGVGALIADLRAEQAS